MGQNLLIEELRNHQICKDFWDNRICEVLEQEIVLEYEPVGEMGVYSSYFEFCMPYVGNEKDLSEIRAFMKLGITASMPDYDIQKAIAGTDCFHNVQIQIKRDEEILAAICFRLWNGKKDKYSGSKEILNLLLHE